jgi:P4 family phage/plasmid primase-like protien
MLTELKTFEDIGYEDSSQVVDNSCCRVPWLLYGSRKDESMEPYIVHKVFDSDGQEISVEEAFENYNIYDMNENKINIKGKVEKYLPRILSIIPYGRDTCDIKSGLISPLKEKRQQKEENQSEYRKVSIQQDLEVAKQLLQMLSIHRAQDRNEWMTIGWALYNIGNGSPEALDLWCQFSSRCEDEYDESVCIYEWERMTEKDLTIGTLRYYASLDNPEQYQEFKYQQASKYIQESLNGSHNDIAHILHEEYGNEFVCASILNKVWFEFNNHRWEQVEEGFSLRRKISGEIVERYVSMAQSLVREFASCKGKAEEGYVDIRMKQVQKMITNLKSAPYKNNVMKENQEVFYDRRFREKLDMNPALFPFKNGVYDLTSNIFRPGRPEDFISKTAAVDYNSNLSEDDESVQDVYEFLEKVFPDKSVRQYFLDISSDIFFGGNHQKHVYFWTGEGDNAKSVTQTLFESMLGKLSIKLNTTVITGKKVQSGAANPELARAGGGVRLVTLEEPNSDEMINIGILKNLSGNDTFYARDLFEKGKEGREIKPLFKIFFICNKLPKLKYSDKAVWNRIRVIPFESTFCRADDPPPDTYEEQLRQKRFPMDPNFSKKIPGMLEAFAWVLLQHRQNLKERIEPEKVRLATAIYRKQNDIYRQFIEECIIEDPKNCLSLSELYSQFKDWFRDSLPNHTLPIKNEIEEYFVKIWGSSERGKTWKGYRIRILQDDIQEGEAVVLQDDDFFDYEGEGDYNIKDVLP